MTIEICSRKIDKVFLDTAPIIYYVENNPNYHSITEAIFEALDHNLLSAVTSPITLSECLVYPYKLGMNSLLKDFIDLITGGKNVTFRVIDQEIGNIAAKMRAKYNLSLPDSLQIATAIQAGCDTFLTNDLQLKRVNELFILVLSDLMEKD